MSASPRVVQAGEPVPKGGGVYRVGKSYAVGGRIYSPEENNDYSAEGTASWYGEDFHGRLTANGEVYDMASISAAHPTLPIPSYARITNLRNKRSIIVRVNDRGPFHRGRLVDVSVRAAKLLGFHDQGTTHVRMEYLGPASLSGSDDSKLEATLRRGTPAPGPLQTKVASVHRSAPVPTGRPFDLDHEQSFVRTARPVPVGENSVAVAHRTHPPTGPSSEGRASPATKGTASSAPPSSFASRFAFIENAPLAAPRLEPSSAYAAELPERANGAVITGRGLY